MVTALPVLANLRTLLRALYLNFTRRRVTVRRTVYVLLALFLYLVTSTVVCLGQWLDDIFYRRYRAQSVRSPLFIIAFPRSGTTFLHRLMCLDEEQFTYLKTYQTLLPAVSFYKFFAFLSAVDRRLGRPLARIDRWFSRHAFWEWRNIHRVRLNQAEEDEGFFLHALHTPALYMLFPFVEELDHLQFSDRLPDGERRRVMGYYRRCIQRHLFASGDGRRLLSKNVHSTGRIASLLEIFPDARFIFILRDPYEAIPSLLSLYHAVWEVHSPDIAKRSPETLALARMGYDYYRHLQEMCERLSEEQFICVGFEELVQDAGPVIARIYEHLALPVSDAFRARLGQAVREQEDYESAHRYSLEEYGLTREMVYRELEEVFEFARQKHSVGWDSPSLGS